MANMPKRKKSKDNPYTLGYDDSSNYFIFFKDIQNRIHKVEVSEKVFDAFDNFELEDISQMHRFERHIEHSEIYEDNLIHRALDKPVLLEDEVEKRFLYKRLKDAINELSDTQRKRIIKYYFENKNIIEIAKEEITTFQAVSKSLNNALIKIKKFLEKN